MLVVDGDEVSCEKNLAVCLHGNRRYETWSRSHIGRDDHRRKAVVDVLRKRRKHERSGPESEQQPDTAMQSSPESSVDNPIQRFCPATSNGNPVHA
ncbi:hypothetical protein [Dokdonella sp.]|uniref:hypothetical protein n=1 Tax=Dokdonella sp. TaxID=2291710 RepID=UPI0025BDFE29|nr:hypothetical protein [Dokdonella sp.]